jgi:3-hydroxyisobutyrate dehydrogenase-like beta-hydroxyacid dehydrogenase
MAGLTDSVGVVGLGNIGRALTRRLLETGDAPFVFDLRPQSIDAVVADGAQATSSARQLAERSDIVIVCVQNDEQCVTAVSGPDGILDGARPGAIIAVLSTVTPATIRALAPLAIERGVSLVDTPVAGRGPFSVAEGTMSVLVGDDREIVERLRPTLFRFASKVVAAGELGTGAALKLAHNIVVYAGLASIIEAVELARAAGVRDGLVEEATQASGALSDLIAFTVPFYKHFRDDPHAPDEDQILGVVAALVDKDLGDAIKLGEAHGLTLPVAQLLSHSGSRIFGQPGELP